MIEVEFDCNQQITKVQGNLDDPFKISINKFLQKSSLEPDNVFFIVNGKPINFEEKIEKQISKMNKENKKCKVLVQLLESTPIIPKYEKSKDIICPKCYEPCRIKIQNFHISLFGCINNHTNTYKIKDFFDSQEINISSIKCEKCNLKNKSDYSNNEFYKCLTCNINLCLLCKTVHPLNHNIINYDQKNYLCNKHNEPFIKYCLKCNKNICFVCSDEEHEKHNKLSLNEMKPNMDEINNNLKEMKKEIDIFSNNIKDIINKLNEIIDIMNIYYEINNNIINNYESKNRNYQILQNINQINNNKEIINNINNIIKTIDLKDKLNNIIDLYININSDKEISNPAIESNRNLLVNNAENSPINTKLNEMTIIYNIDKNKNEIKLFNEKFVKNNKDNCYLLIDEKQTELCSSYKLNDNQKEKNTLKIKLIETKHITNMSSMFSICTSLISLPDFSNWDTTHVTNVSSLFNNCSSLKSLPDISNWNTYNVTNMSWMFAYCNLIKSLPDISKWNTINVTDMSDMFNNCNALETLPDISNWNTANVTDMSEMFAGCVSLKSLPDISRWRINENLSKDYMFDGCDENIIPEDF